MLPRRLAVVVPALAWVLVLGACAASRPADPSSPPAPPPAEAPPAPWSAPPLPPSEAPAALVEAWRRADNRATCAPLAPATLGAYGEATPREATFGGGWGLAYDLPGQRSAFGVAGTGVAAADDAYDAWPNWTLWADGSTAGYGPEGGTGPNTLAYLRVEGQGCLYNVWSRLGEAHLETLLAALRFVDV